MKKDIEKSKNAVECTIKKIQTFCVCCKKNNASKNSSVTRTRKVRLILASHCTFCDKRSRLIKNQKAIALFSKWGIRTPLIHISFIGDTLFKG